MSEIKSHIPAIICDADKLSQIAFIQELGRCGIPVIAVASDQNAIGFKSRFVHKSYFTEIKSYESAYIDYLIETLPAGVIYYSNDANVENLSRQKNRLRDSGFHIMVTRIETISRVLDKYELYEVCQQCGINYPKTWLINSERDLTTLIEQSGFPLIIKSSNLSGGVYALVRDREHLLQAYRKMQKQISGKQFIHRHPKLLIQQWIEPERAKFWNFNALVKDGAIVSLSMGQRIRTDVKQDGTFGSLLLHGQTEMNRHVLLENERLFSFLNYDGFVETEWSTSQNNDRPFLYDFNPRPTGNIRWVFKSGVSMGEHYYRLNLNLPLNGNFKMKEGIKYYKIFYHDNDFLHSVDSPRSSAFDSLTVLFENFNAILNFRLNAIDILDVGDIAPTFRACRSLLKDLLKGIVKLLIKFLFPKRTLSV